MTRTTLKFWKTGRHALVACAVALVAFILGTAISPALGLTSPPLTFGRIPVGALTSDGINWSVVPDYVAVVSHGHLVGYVAKSALDQLGPRVGPLNGGTYTPAGNEDLSVVNSSLKVVGHMVPRVGFIPADQGLGGDLPSGVTPTTVYGSSAG